ncbi:MAG: hypothetical protein HRU10_14680 [Opitutales bacterium]|nr:hypothetical protein [Opitutales bacterium]
MIRKFVLLGVYCLLAHALVADTSQTLPFEVDFEAEEGFILGELDGGHAFFDESSVLLSIEPTAASGLNGLMFKGSGIWGVDFDSLDSTVWIDFYVKPQFGEFERLPENVDDPQAAVTAFASSGLRGDIYVLDGDGQGGGFWFPLGLAISLPSEGELPDWVRITYRLDYLRKTWDIFINDDLFFTDLGFLDDAIDRLSLLRFGATDAAAYLDFLYAGVSNPLFLDSDNDGISDAYEIASGLNVFADDRAEDPDFDSVANILEFMNAWSATNPDTDGDGVHDGEEFRLGEDPLVAGDFAIWPVPLFETFDGYMELSSLFDAGWEASSQDWVALSSAPWNANPFIELEGGSGNQVLSVRSTSSNALPVWVDMAIKPTRFPRRAHPEVPSEAASVFFFDTDARLNYFDRDTLSWQVDAAVLDESASWQRVTTRLDFQSQLWSLWLNNRLVVQDAAFSNRLPYFTGVEFQKNEGASGDPAQIDAITASYHEPAFLDDDGDGVPNVRELGLGQDPRTPEQFSGFIREPELQFWISADTGVTTETGSDLWLLGWISLVFKKSYIPSVPPSFQSR